MKQFYIQNNIGKAKYVVNFHDGEKTHTDGSKFFDIRIFSNKIKAASFVKELQGYGYALDC